MAPNQALSAQDLTTRYVLKLVRNSPNVMNSRHFVSNYLLLNSLKNIHCFLPPKKQVYSLLVKAYPYF